MQNVIFYVAAPETLGVVRDYANAKSASAPTLVRACEVCLKMRLFANSDGTAAYPITAFANIISWQWAMDKDFNEATDYILEADNANITVATVTDEVDGTEIEYTEFSIPIPDMNTEELATWLGTDKSKIGLAGELVGFDAESKQVFVLQVENFTVRNRITGLGTPTPISPDYLTASQVRALIASGIAVQYSVDGSTLWHDTQVATDRYIRIRSASDINAAWSDAIGLVVGPQGAAGVDSFCYVAYASDNAGTGFSTTPTNGLKFRAEIHVSEEIESPSIADFEDAVWVKYLGDDGTGVGDMLKSTYDSDNDGVVDNADHAAEADAVPWSGVSGKPSTFAPAAHTHTISAISDPNRKKVIEESNPATLYLDSPIIRKSSNNTSADIALDFTSVKTAVDGSAYVGASGDYFSAWQYHIPCTQVITGITVGGIASTMEGVDIPDTLSLIDNATTVHVFVIEAIYDNTAFNKLRMFVNYARSYKA